MLTGGVAQRTPTLYLSTHPSSSKVCTLSPHLCSTVLLSYLEAPGAQRPLRHMCMLEHRDASVTLCFSDAVCERSAETFHTTVLGDTHVNRCGCLLD